MSTQNANIEYLFKSKNKSFGFSLIELSIVLIIIGLLVAGITGGASLIKSAELRAVMGEIRNYQTAINSYYLATGQLPGSEGSSRMSIKNTGQSIADMVNEGILDAKLSCFAGTAGNYTCSQSDTINSGVNAPVSKMKGAHISTTYWNDNGKNILLFLSGDIQIDQLRIDNNDSSAPSRYTPSAPMGAKDAKILDQKLDDGISDNGNFFVFSKYSSCSGVTCDYNDKSNNKNCNICVNIDL